MGEIDILGALTLFSRIFAAVCLKVLQLFVFATL